MSLLDTLGTDVPGDEDIDFDALPECHLTLLSSLSNSLFSRGLRAKAKVAADLWAPGLRLSSVGCTKFLEKNLYLRCLVATEQNMQPILVGASEKLRRSLRLRSCPLRKI